MAVLNGIGAVVSLDAAGGTSFTEVSTTKGWSIQANGAVADSVPSNNSAGRIVTPGVKDFTGSFDFDGRDFPLYPGDSGNFLGYNGSKSVQALIIVESATINVDVAGSANVGGTVNFGGNGAITFGSTSDADASNPQVFNSVGAGRIDWKPAGEVAFATLPDVTAWSLTLANTLAPYSSTTSAGITKRTAGSKRASGTFTILQGTLDYLSTAATILTPGSVGILRKYVSASTYFEIHYATLTGLDFGAVPDQNGAVTIPYEVSLGAWVSAAWAPGKVIKPGGTYWFGSA